MNRVEVGDCREILPLLPDGVFQCCVTSPPYWGLRDYGHPGQIGLEATPEAYVAELVGVFREVRRVLCADGTLWLNLGDSYHGGGYSNHRINGEDWAESMNGDKRRSRQQDRINANPGLKPKDLVGVPWMVAFALRADGWYLRSDIIWAKPRCMPESVRDRPSKAHEYVFMLTKSSRYFYGIDAVREPHTMKPQRRRRARGKDETPRGSGQPKNTFSTSGPRDEPAVDGHPLGKNIRDVWDIAPETFDGAHFATMPTALATKCILAGSALGDAVLDPFMGSGTVGEVAEALGRRWFGCDLNPDYGKLARERTAQAGLPYRGSS